LDAPPPRYTNVSLYWVAQVRRGGPPPGGTYRCGYRADGRYRHLSGRGAATSAGSRADHRDGAQTIRSRRATCESALEWLHVSRTSVVMDTEKRSHSWVGHRNTLPPRRCRRGARQS